MMWTESIVASIEALSCHLPEGLTENTNKRDSRNPVSRSGFKSGDTEFEADVFK